MTGKSISSCLAVIAIVAGASAAFAAAKELKGAAILDHPCGKLTVQHMGLVNAGKMEEAVKLATPEMQAEWKAMAQEERDMITGMMKEMSVTGDVHAAEIKAHGLLSIEGDAATLTLTKEEKGAEGGGTSTLTQKFKITGATCAITH
jgi:hypothetical protein